MRYVLEHDRSQCLKLTREEARADEARIERLVSAVVLDEIPPCSADRFTDPLHYFVGMVFPYHRGAEFIVGSPIHDELDTLHVRKTVRRFSGELSVPIDRILDIHRDIIDESLIEEIPDHFGIAPVRIELHEESELFDPSTKDGKIDVDRRLSSADHNSVYESYAGLEKAEENFLADHVPFGLSELLWEHEFGIMTVTAPEIATGRKDERRDLSRIVEKGGFLDSGNEHLRWINTGRIARTANPLMCTR